MNYTIYRMTFPVGVHFGDGRLEHYGSNFSADTFFSALCQEALNCGGEENLAFLMDAVKNNELRFSDGLPFCGDTYYIPKPILALDLERESDSIVKKKLKKLTHLPCELVDEYMTGTLDIEQEVKKLAGLGVGETRPQTSSRGGNWKSMYHVGIWHFRKGNGLYVIAAFEGDEIKKRLDSLLTSLSYSGIGGKRSSGLGRFELEEAAVPEALLRRLEAGAGATARRRMTLAGCLPEEVCFDAAVEGASYGLLRRGGFISSKNDAVFYKKQESYLFAAGSCFTTAFAGQLINAAPMGHHPVWRYAKPLFVEV